MKSSDKLQQEDFKNITLRDGEGVKLVVQISRSLSFLLFHMEGFFNIYMLILERDKKRSDLFYESSYQNSTYKLHKHCVMLRFWQI